MFKIVVPVFALIFIIIMLFSYQRKSKAAFDFNSELIEANTMELKDLLDELKGAINTLEDKINPVDYSKKIEIIEVIKIDDKTEIYNLIKKIIDKFEKCNYIIEAQNSKLPFPYTEVVMNGFMIVICIGVLLYIYGQLKPFGRIYNIKELNRIKEETIYADIDKFKELKKEVEFLKNCHNDDIDTVIYTLKIMFFMFIVMFLIFYSTKIVSSTSEFKAGLFNSFYFETQTKYPL
jgi:cbb3-type cytochrome oxidase subunit 3